uniref:Spore protein YkvP/CgeB glycosyl transferase-like domain-containing protein n=1 Tax=Palpitomonas bilix TaxID=652834 RepID=A0A7S3DD29_9EUKA|mmetsp:Transcript_30188/g.78004  ORF Transcript_30188/g.78004 Transcript_30188/m.78004 type:complete len:1123 (+) Transcript_30188:231-3599(+)
MTGTPRRRKKASPFFIFAFVAISVLVISQLFLFKSVSFGHGKAPSVSSSKSHRVSSNLESRERPSISNGPPRQKPRIALICDEFTFEHLEVQTNDVDFLVILPDLFLHQLEWFEPDALFVESIWKGRDMTWQGVVTKFKPTHKLILEVINWFKIRQKKVFYWSKEDPPNYDLFQFMAKICDYVFTTSIESLSRYEEDLPATSKAELFALGIQPEIHNPFSSGVVKIEKKEDSCFAGSWMAFKYPVRGEHLTMLFDAALKVGRLSILDRTSGYTNKMFRYPEKYEPYLRPALPYNETLLYYRSCKSVLNVNSVQNSVTMLSRRVLELPAMGVDLVTATSHAIDFFLPEGAITVVKTPEETEDALRKASSAKAGAQKSIGLTRRTLAIDHSYTARFSRVAEIIGMRPLFKNLHIIGYSYIDSCKALGGKVGMSPLERVLRSYLRQHYMYKTLVIFVSSDEEVVRCRAAVNTDEVIFSTAPDSMIDAMSKVGTLPDVVDRPADLSSLSSSFSMLRKAILSEVPVSDVYRYYASIIDPSSYYGRLYFRDVASAAVSKYPVFIYKHHRYLMTSGGEVEESGQLEMQCGTPTSVPPLSLPSLSFSLELEGFKSGACVTDPYDFIEGFYNSALENEDAAEKVVKSVNVDSKSKARRSLFLIDLPSNYYGRMKRMSLIRSIFKIFHHFAHREVDILMLSSFADFSVEPVPSSKEICKGSELVKSLLDKNKKMASSLRLLDPFGVLHCNESDSFDLFTSAILMKRVVGFQSVRSSVLHGVRMSPAALKDIGMEVSRSFEYDTVMAPSSLFAASSLSSLSSSLIQFGLSPLHPAGSHMKMIVYIDTPRHGQDNDVLPFHLSCSEPRWRNTALNLEVGFGRPFMRAMAFSILDPLLTSPCSKSVIFMGERVPEPAESKPSESKAGGLCFWGHSERYRQDLGFLDGLVSAFSGEHEVKLYVRDLSSYGVLDKEYVPSHAPSAGVAKAHAAFYPPSGVPPRIEARERRELGRAEFTGKDRVYFRFNPNPELPNPFENCTAIALSSIPVGSPMLDSQMVKMDELLHQALKQGLPVAIEHVQERVHSYMADHLFFYSTPAELREWAEKGFSMASTATKGKPRAEASEEVSDFFNVSI